MKYYLCWGVNPDGLSKAVNVYLAKGWSLYGQPFEGETTPKEMPDVYCEGMQFPSNKYYPAHRLFCQALILDKED